MTACSSPRSSGPTGTTSASWGPSDVRRVRSSRTGPGRGSSHVFRPARAAAPRPGVGRDRSQRREQADGAARPRARRPGLRRTKPLGTAGRSGDRAHALLDDRRQWVGERPAPAAPWPHPDRRARPQRQPRQRRSAAADGGQAPRLELGLGGDRRVDRRRRTAARTGRAGGDGEADGRGDGRRPRRRTAVRVPRRPRISPARARAARRRSGDRIGDLCAGARRRGVRA